MEQSWQRMKAQIMSSWEGLDEGDLKSTRGDLAQLVDLIHARTGEDRTQIRRKVVALL